MQMLMDLRGLDTRLLAAYVALVEEGGVEPAAKRLGLTQSAISHALKVLQDDVGVQLLARCGRRILPTAEGATFFEDAVEILTKMKDARERLQNQGRWNCVRLRVGASTAACQYLLPTVFREFRESFPETPVFIEPGDTPRVLELLRQGQVDIAIGLKTELLPDFASRPLFKDELRLIMSPLHELAEAKRINGASLTNCNFILYNKASATSAMIQEYLLSQGVSLRRTMELHSVEAIKELVKVNLGVSILPPWMLAKELESKSLVQSKLPGKKLTRHWVVHYPVSRQLNLGEETFIGLCEATARNLRLERLWAEG